MYATVQFNGSPLNYKINGNVMVEKDNPHIITLTYVNID